MMFILVDIIKIMKVTYLCDLVAFILKTVMNCVLNGFVWIRHEGI